MENSIFIFLIIISCWLIFYSFFFYYACSLDRSFKLFIYHKNQLHKYLGYLLGVILFLGYIFVFRLLGIKRTLDTNFLVNKLETILNELNISSLIILSLLGIIWLVFFFSLVSWITLFVKKLLLALYLYFRKYKQFDKHCGKVLSYTVDFKFFFFKLVMKHTRDLRILKIVRAIWPSSMLALEKFTFKYLLIYLWLYDYMVNFGIIEKVFIVLPWFYIYGLLRQLRNYILKIDSIKNGYKSKWKYGEPK